MLSHLALGLMLSVSSPALASEDGGEHPTEQHDGEHGDSHGDSHVNHYVADANGNGIADWRDADSEHYVVMDLVHHAFNLAVLFALLFVFGRGPMGDMLRARAVSIRAEISEATELRDQAEARYAEIKQRLDVLEAEIGRMEEQGQAAAEVEEQKLVARAEAEAERIRKGAQRTIADESARAVRALRAEAVELAMELARGALTAQVNNDDQKRLAQQFLDSVGQESQHG